MKRDIQNKVIAGVCSGIAKSVGVDPFIIRAAFVGSVLLAGVGLGLAAIVYAVLWVTVPVEN